MINTTMDLREARKQFIIDLESKNRSKATVIAYGKDIEQLVEYLEKVKGKTAPSEPTKEDIDGFMTSLRDKGFTNKSISRKTNSTKTFFKFLRNSNVINEDPALLVAHPKFETKPPRILTKLEYRALRDACRHDKRTSAIVELLLQTGIRIGELASLKIKDITFSKDETVHGSLHVTAENGTERDIPLNRAVQSALRDYLDIRGSINSESLFVTKTGNPLLIRNIRTAIDRYFRLAGIDNAKVNDLRHTFIAHHLRRGTSLVVVSRLTGHKRLATTEKYLQYIDRVDDEKIELDEL